MPDELKWTDAQPMVMPLVSDSLVWKIVHKQGQTENSLVNLKNLKPAAGTSALKRSCDDSELTSDPPKKKARVIDFIDAQLGPVGFVWDSLHHSCPYDSLFSILADIWLQNPVKWNDNFHSLNNYMKMLATGLSEVINREKTLESVRNEVRTLLYTKDPVSFHMDARGSFLNKIAAELLSTTNYVSTICVCCTQCGDQHIADMMNYHVYVSATLGRSTNEAMKKLQVGTRKHCPRCNRSSSSIIYYCQAPKLLFVELATQKDDICTISRWIKIMFGHTRNTALLLRGIIYWVNRNHFVSRIITKEREVWFNDGISTGRQSYREGKLSDFLAEELLSYNNAPACLCIYAQM
jgi:hypothetical protein